MQLIRTLPSYRNPQAVVATIGNFDTGTVNAGSWAIDVGLEDTREGFNVSVIVDLSREDEDTAWLNVQTATKDGDGKSGLCRQGEGHEGHCKTQGYFQNNRLVEDWRL